ncbi:hypothetical protein L1887_41900 [Cichorium endivia]|nr:hypothetical protein L1887_41900 [Cichorium endivia]
MLHYVFVDFFKFLIYFSKLFGLTILVHVVIYLFNKSVLSCYSTEFDTHSHMEKRINVLAIVASFLREKGFVGCIGGMWGFGGEDDWVAKGDGGSTTGKGGVRVELDGGPIQF